MNTRSVSSATSASERAPYGIAPSQHRLPGGTRLGRVSLQVSELERSLAFYQRVLGFRVVRRSPGRVTLAEQGAEAPRLELRERAGATPVPARGRLGLFHFAVLLPTRAALGAFLRHLSEIGEAPGASDHQVSEALYLRDPDGLGIEVYADRPRSTWQTRGRELRIETAPLDAAAVLAEGGDTPWTGLPAGTTIGHVHLHVADLAHASAFYHDALGMDRMTWSYPGALFLGADGYHHHLGLNTWAGSGALRPQDSDARLLYWELVLPTAEDVEAAARSLERAGHPVVREPDGWSAADPSGTALRVRPEEPEVRR